MRCDVALSLERGGIRVAGMRRVLTALREVAAEAGLEHAARGALGGGVATRGVEAGDDFEHVGGELVERDHGSYGDGSPTVVAMVMATRLW